jgi:hypothetical protein
MRAYKKSSTGRKEPEVKNDPMIHSGHRIAYRIWSFLTVEKPLVHDSNGKSVSRLVGV